MRHTLRVPRDATEPPRGLIFGFIRGRSSAFSRIRFNAVMHVTDMNGIRPNYHPKS
jgi:hypothetical protein